MNLNKSPKGSALEESNFLRRHHDLMEQPQLAISLDCALLQYLWILNEKPEPEDPSARAFKLQGIHDFLKVFRNLAEPAEVAKVSDTVNLTGNRK